MYEPDAWRFLGIAGFLLDFGIRVVDGCPQREPSFAIHADVDAVMLAQTLIDRFGTDIIEQVRAASGSAAILVHGEAGFGGETAPLLALGVQGYFPLASPQKELMDALGSRGRRHLGAARRVALLAQQPAENDDRALLKLLLEGLSNKEIAARCGVAEVTVKARLTRLYKRHRVRTRLQLLSAAIRQRLIDHDLKG